MKKTILTLLIFISTSPFATHPVDTSKWVRVCDGTTEIITIPGVRGEARIYNSVNCQGDLPNR